MSGFGVPQPDIAFHLGVDPKTLRKHFREELDRGSIEATTKVAHSLSNMATQGNNVAAAIFWMKARAGWREKQEIEFNVRPIERATDDDLMKLIMDARRQVEIDEAADDTTAVVQFRGPG
jgi:hypothetical protein